MPNMVVNPDNTTAFSSVHEKVRSYRDRYPRGLVLKPGTDTHNELVSKVMTRAYEAYDAMSPRYDSWRKIDRTLTTFIHVDDAEKTVQDEDPRRPVSIVVPYTYATMETLLTYLTRTFFKDPIFKYGGVGPEDTIGAMLLEHVVARQTKKGKARVKLHTFFRDCLAYGFGAITPVWETVYGVRKRKTGQMVGIVEAGEQFPMPTTVTERYVRFEGNVLYNIDPYKALFSPNVPIHEFQRGEFFGWYGEDSYINLKAQEQEDESLFNIDYLKYTSNYKGGLFGTREDDRERQTGTDTTVASSTTRGVGLVTMYIRLIPKEWGLGKEENPEIWTFVVANESVLLRAERLELDHGMFPIAVAAPDTDGYSIAPQSRLEVLYGLQHVVDFLFNSHIANVRKAVNDTIVYDPSVINSKDMADPKAGKLIRLRRPAWGKGISQFIQQLQINDVTRQNIGDAEWVMKMMQNISAANDSTMGLLRQGGPERLTQAEYRGAEAGALSRLGRIAEMISEQALSDLAFLYASQTQQLMSEQVYVQLTGEWQARLQADFGLSAQGGKVMADPQDMLVDYDVEFLDWVSDEGGDLGTWVDMYKTIAGDQELRQQYDTFRLFSYIVKKMGVKNAEEFRRATNNISATTMPDEQVLQQVERGNLIPMTDLEMPNAAQG